MDFIKKHASTILFVSGGIISVAKAILDEKEKNEKLKEYVEEAVAKQLSNK